MTDHDYWLEEREKTRKPNYTRRRIVADRAVRATRLKDFPLAGSPNKQPNRIVPRDTHVHSFVGQWGHITEYRLLSTRRPHPASHTLSAHSAGRRFARPRIPIFFSSIKKTQALRCLQPFQVRLTASHRRPRYWP